MAVKPIQIHLADTRHLRLTRAGQTLHTIEDGTAVGLTHWLYAFSDNAVRPSSEITHPVSCTGTLFVLPLVGRAQVQLRTEQADVEAGQLYFVPVLAGDVVSVSNLFRNEWINYLLWEVPAVGHEQAGARCADIELRPNELHRLDCDANLGSVHIGQFAGRAEYTLDFAEASDVFIFTIEGAFEVQNRLLHARDGLSLPCARCLEFEALSNNAIILVLSRGGLHQDRENG
ncbi:MAG: hypothetical protein HC859_00180 [Bacteroidia bacterium]|nr:hypothetical protein [Bacteroidia bacterium]